MTGVWLLPVGGMEEVDAGESVGCRHGVSAGSQFATAGGLRNTRAS